MFQLNFIIMPPISSGIICFGKQAGDLVSVVFIVVNTIISSFI